MQFAPRVICFSVGSLERINHAFGLHRVKATKININEELAMNIVGFFVCSMRDFVNDSGTSLPVDMGTLDVNHPFKSSSTLTSNRLE